MANKGKKRWYIMAYDIRDPKRLKRLHSYLKKRALALQKSVFVYKADDSSLERTMAGVKALVDDGEDDVRLYPITTPDAIWVAGKQASALGELYAEVERQPAPAGLRGFLKKLMGRNKK